VARPHGSNFWGRRQARPLPPPPLPPFGRHKSPGLQMAEFWEQSWPARETVEAAALAASADAFDVCAEDDGDCAATAVARRVMMTVTMEELL
jgi:hypothetical protein